MANINMRTTEYINLAGNMVGPYLSISKLCGRKKIIAAF